MNTVVASNHWRQKEVDYKELSLGSTSVERTLSGLVASSNLSHSDNVSQSPHDDAQAQAIHSIALSLPATKTSHKATEKFGKLHCTSVQYTLLALGVFALLLCSAASLGLLIWMKIIAAREGCSLRCSDDSAQ